MVAGRDSTMGATVIKVENTMNATCNAAVELSQRLLSVREVAVRLGVCADTVRDLIRRGRLVQVKLSPRCVRVDPVSVDRLIRESSK